MPDRSTAHRSSVAIQLKVDSLEGTNLALRATWAALRKEFGKLAWHYMGVKQRGHNSYLIGDADIGLPGQALVELKYTRKDVGKTLVFNWRNHDGSNPEHVVSRIERCVTAALADRTPKSTFNIVASAQLIPQLLFHNYSSKTIGISGHQNGVIDIRLTCNAFDNVDAISEANEKIGPISDIISIASNSCVEIDKIEIISSTKPETQDDQCSVFSADPDWLEGHGVEDRSVRISNSIWERLNVISASSCRIVDPVALASRHFHDGLRLYHNKATWSATSLTLFVSALECLAVATKSETCSSCGQPKYSIKKRVRDLVAKSLSDPASRLIAKQYDIRSGYLHQGRFSSHMPAFVRVRPLLDPNSGTGMIRYAGADDPHVTLEFTGYTVRKYLRIPNFDEINEPEISTVEAYVKRWSNMPIPKFLLNIYPLRFLIMKKIVILDRGRNL